MRIIIQKILGSRANIQTSKQTTINSKQTRTEVNTEKIATPLDSIDRVVTLAKATSKWHSPEPARFNTLFLEVEALSNGAVLSPLSSAINLCQISFSPDICIYLAASHLARWPITKIFIPGYCTIYYRFSI